MNRRRLMKSTGLALACCLLVACGGGGGVGPVVGGGISGTGKTGVKFGDVTLAGGITVGGTVFTATTATVRIGDQTASPGDLRDGHVALVEGVITGARGIADTITVEEIVKGVLQSRPSANVLLVQGQQVEVDERTIYGPGIAPASADGLVVGDLLEIWGFVRGPGLVRATRIEREDSLSEIRIVGVASNVDANADTFEIGTQGIDHGQADVSKLPTGDPVNGDLVRVRGAAVLDGGGRVSATRVELLGITDHEDNDETEVEGFVTAVLSPTEFRLGTVKVRTDATTRFVGGLAADIEVGLQLEAEGALVDGVLHAREVEFKEDARVEGDVASIAGGLIAITGFPGLVVRVDDLTEFEDNASQLSDIQVGDHVEIQGRVAGPSTIAAVQVKETDPKTDIRIQGPVDAVPSPSNPVLSILGVAIDTSSIPNGEFESPSGAALDRAGFFALLTPGLLVEIEGDLVGGNPVWAEAEIEDE